MKTFSITDIGQRREMNQDYVFSSEKPVGNLPNLFLVADGMGGHQAGDYASRFAVENLVSYLKQYRQGQVVSALLQGIKTVNAQLYKRSMEEPYLRGMGTTLVAASIEDDTLYVANIGDSRLYLYREHSMVQITRDHSFVEEMIRMGGLDSAAARNHHDKNIITTNVAEYEWVLKPDAKFFPEI